MDLGTLRLSEVHGSYQPYAPSQEGRTRQQLSLCQDTEGGSDDGSYYRVSPNSVQSMD